MRSGRNALVWALLLGAALGVRLAAGVWWESRLPPGLRFGFGDSESYWALARTIAQGKPYRYGENGPQVFRTPGYPLILAPLFLIYEGEPPTMAGRAIGAVLGTAAVAGVGMLAGLCFDQRTALAAALLAAFEPGAVAMSVFLLSEAPFCPLMLLQLIAWTKAWKAPSSRSAVAWSLAAGIAAASATLMRPSWLLFTPFALGIAVAFSRARARHVQLGAWMLLALAVTMSPWWIRNFLATGRFVPTTLQVGASFYDGLSPYATGASDMRPVDAFGRQYRETHPLDQRRPGAEWEVELDRALRDVALRWARENPAGALRLAAVKFVRMWNVWPNAAEFQSWKLRLIVALSYTPLMILALWGAWRWAPRGWPYALCIMPAMYFTLLHMIFVSSIRYRQPAMLALIVLAAAILGSREWGVGNRKPNIPDP
jgi:4-amino-4-deoxy-L-arabinose transferase-like glycosyltransferase